MDQPSLPEQSIQQVPAALSKGDRFSLIFSIIFGAYFIVIFIIQFLSVSLPKPITDLLQTNFAFTLFVSVPLFLSGVLSIVPIVIFLSLIIGRVRYIREGKGSATWSLVAIVLNTIPLAILVTSLLLAGCAPGLICF